MSDVNQNPEFEPEVAEPAFSDEADRRDGAPPQYGVGPFSLREVILAGVWLVAFVISFFPFISAGPFGFSVWTIGLDWILAIGLPTVAIFLLALRRLSPTGIRRVGSLGIDQFASVAFSVAAVTWLSRLWSSFAVSGSAVTWVGWVMVVLMLAGVVLTVAAPFIPTLREDFLFRDGGPAHRVAAGARPIAPRPPAPAVPAAEASVPETATPAVAAAPAAALGSDDDANASVPPKQAQQGYWTTPDEPTFESEFAQAFEPDPEPETRTEVSSDGAEPEPVVDVATRSEEDALTADGAAAETAPAASQAFWGLVPEPRTIVDEQGAPLFTIDQTAWALVIEDRGDHYVVRHDDGRVGFLRDVSGVTRG